MKGEWYLHSHIPLGVDTGVASPCIRRIGQRNPVTYTYRLFRNSIAIERQTDDRQAIRKEFIENVNEIKESI